MPAIYKDGDRERKAKMERIQGGKALRNLGVQRGNFNQPNLRADRQGHQLPDGVRRTGKMPPGGRE